MEALVKKISGIFFEESNITLGTGHTQKQQLLKNYCIADQTSATQVKLSFLGDEGKPTGIEITMAIDEFLKRFTFEPSYAPPKPKSKEFFSAEWEYNKALKIEPENVRANFGVGTLYMEMGETDKAKTIFKKLAAIEAIFEDENKHIFNEFGITLRKSKMFEEALANYMKAIEISPKDENLYFNVARLYYDMQVIKQAKEWLQKALNLNANFWEAKQFMEFLKTAKASSKHDDGDDYDDRRRRRDDEEDEGGGDDDRRRRGRDDNDDEDDDRTRRKDRFKEPDDNRERVRDRFKEPDDDRERGRDRSHKKDDDDDDDSEDD